MMKEMQNNCDEKKTEKFTSFSTKRPEVDGPELV